MKKLLLNFWLLLLCMIAGAGTAWSQAPVNTSLWEETWTGGTKDETPSDYGFEGTTVWGGATLTYAQSSTNTKLYNETLAGGTSPELLLSKNNQTWTISGIPTGQATEMTLTFLSNKATFTLSSSTKGITISGSGTSWTISQSSDLENFDLTLKNTGSSNARIDNVVLKVKTAGSGGTVLEDNDLALTGAPIALNFDLYNNSTAQVINYTTSSSGAVTIADSEYATFAINETAKTITVTPTAVTPSMQTITVNQAADATYKAGSVTFAVTVTDSTPIPTHTATFSVNGNTTAQEFEEGATIIFPSNPADVNGRKFVGWVAEAIEGTTNVEPSFVTSATMSTNDVTYYAVFATVTPGSQTEVTDNLTSSTFGSPSSYGDWSGKSATDGSSAVYAGNSTTYSSSAIQIRSSNNSGVVSTTSGGKLSKVVLVWNQSTTDGRVLDIYGSNKAYSTASDLYSNSTRGTLISSSEKTNEAIGKEIELTIEGDYEYIGFRSRSNALYLNSVSVTWLTGTPDTYSAYCTTVPEAVAVTGVVLDQTSKALYVGEEFDLEATIAPANATVKTVTWTSSDETKATVVNGHVTALAAGTPTITVTTTDGSFTATCELTISNVAVTGVSLNKDAATIYTGSVGNTVQLTPTIAPANATINTVSWESSDEAVATVDENGLVTAVAEGTATITVTTTDGNFTATCEVTVENAPGSAEKPYTVAQAIEATPSSGTSEKVYIHGFVSAFYNTSIVGDGSNYRYYISDDGTTTNQLLVYKGKGLEESTFTNASDLEIGDEVVIYGGLTTYNTTKEIASGNYLISRKEKPASDLTKTGDITLDFKNGNTVATLTDYFTTSSTGAITYTVADETVIENVDELISALKVGTTTVTVSQAATLSYKAGEIIINVTVQDTREAATTIPAINVSTLKVGNSGTVSVTNPVKADEGVTFSYASSDDGVLLIVDDAYEAVAVGTATVTVTATPSNTNLYKPVVANFEVTVEADVKTNTEIALDEEDGSTIYGTQKSVDFLITDGYDGEMSYTIDNSAIADVQIGASAITFTPKAAGTAVITISAPATATFNAAEDVEYTLTVTAPEGQTTAAVSSVTLFNETFDKCGGSGGRDGNLSGSVGTASTTDKLDEEWATIGDNGAYQCIKLGTGKATGSVVTSDIALSGSGTLTFSAAGWNDTNTNTIQVSAEGATLSGDVDVTLTNGEWNSYIVNITEATGTVAITFTMKRGFLDDVVVKNAGASITAKLNASGYATFCSQYPLDFTTTDGYTAWQIKSISGETITFEKITGAIKGGQGILLKGDAGATVTLASADSENEMTANLLFGTTAPTYIAADEYYGLSGNMFKKVKAGVVPAGKALLPASKIPSTARELTFVFEDGGTTGIKLIDNSQSTIDNYYDLQGRKVNTPKAGLYIKNGKKVMIK